MKYSRLGPVFLTALGFALAQSEQGAAQDQQKVTVNRSVIYDSVTLGRVGRIEFSGGTGRVYNNDGLRVGTVTRQSSSKSSKK